MPKRKSNAVDDGEAVAPRRSTRHKPSAAQTAEKKTPAAKTSADKKEAATGAQAEPRKKPKSKTARPAAKAADTATDSPSAAGRQYWLMKAEPDSRFENGTDVKFSIDDLAAKTEPEPWDGIRAYPEIPPTQLATTFGAMKKGELAFFYHSNCKEPSIVGTMQIVQEHSPDLSAHDPKAPYYDPSSKPADPKWSVVHVRFQSKFKVPITLKELREMGAAGKSLENMQMLKQSRLSVSKVSPAEWEHLMGVAAQKAA